MSNIGLPHCVVFCHWKVFGSPLLQLCHIQHHSSSHGLGLTPFHDCHCPWWYPRTLKSPVSWGLHCSWGCIFTTALSWHLFRNVDPLTQCQGSGTFHTPSILALSCLLKWCHIRTLKRWAASWVAALDNLDHIFSTLTLSKLFVTLSKISCQWYSCDINPSWSFNLSWPAHRNSKW